MNFFEHQQSARRRSAIYLLLFIGAATAVVAVANLVVLGVIFFLDDATDVPFKAWLYARPGVFFWTTFLVFSFVGGASVYRMASLASGGGRVARELGGTRADASTGDLSQRTLVNVVEEMALAAGVPVPEVYVLEKEDGINAFAAGFGTSDAAIAVTQGALVRLNRDELQGVIAHEFSHILNGDMRLNTQLIGGLYGIMAIGLVGRLILRALRASNDARAAIVGLFPGVTLTVVGYLGLFFGRLIQAAVSRSRESLADASAVQYTRNPAGLASALKKIAVTPFQGILRTNASDEISHMLIADGRKLYDQFFATHPPLLERIKAIEPRFDPAELERIKLRPVVIEEKPRTPRAASGAALAISPALIVAAIGQLSEAQLDTANRREAAIPDNLRRAAHSRVHAPSLVVALALNRDPGERTRQVARLRQRLPQDALPHLEAVVTLVGALPPEQRLPLIELAFPALRQRGADELQALVVAIEEITRMDGRFDVLDYALVRLLRMQLREAAAPSSAPVIYTTKLHAVRDEISVLISILAQAGHRDKHLAHRAYEAGVRELLGANTPPYAPPDPWMAPLDRALTRLDRLGPLAKQSLIEGLVVTIAHDKHVTLGEMELLRAVCASLHCPVPPLELTAQPAVGDNSGSHVAA